MGRGVGPSGDGLVAAARATTDHLRAEGIVEDDFIVVPPDGNWDPDLELVARTLAEAEFQARPDLAAVMSQDILDSSASGHT